MEPEQVDGSSVSLDRKRQMRRRKVLENSKIRMEKLKNVQRSPSLAAEYENDGLQPEPAPDPPDEIITKLPSTSTNNSNFVHPPSSEAAPSATSSSKLNDIVCGFMEKGMWRCRTFLAVLCGLSVVWLGQLVSSGVILMCTLDSALMSYVVLTHHPSDLTSNPLGKISLLKIPLMLVHSAGAKWFDTVCLSLWLMALVFRDVLLMIFTTIVTCCILHVSSGIEWE